MTDPTEEALRAIESKYYPLVLDGKCLMPFYPREDVRVMIEAAITAEREACAKVVLSLPPGDGFGGLNRNDVASRILNRKAPSEPSQGVGPDGRHCD